MGLVSESSGVRFGNEPGPPYNYNGRKEPKTLLKTQTRWDAKYPMPRSYQRTGRNPPRWGTKEKDPPLMGLTVGNSGTPFGEESGPPYSDNGRKGLIRSPLETKTLLKTQTRWDGKDPTPRSYQRTGRNPPRWVTKPGPPIQSLNQTHLWGHGVRGWEGTCNMVAEVG